MPDKNESEIVYFRSKSDSIGAIVVGCLLLAASALVLTQDSIGGIGFSKDLTVMVTYLAAPLGVVLVLANLRHVMAKGPTMVAMRDGITVLFTDQRVGPLHWSAITGFIDYKHQGKHHLGITLEDPMQALYPHKDYVADLVQRKGPKAAHVKIDGKMLDDEMKTIVSDLEGMRQLYSWRAR